ncbi:FAD-binding oxidoreductase [Curvibacter sp. APW13]|uniref:NAD(P)/FAD-dependent oxidoreductase n=1 Tax=Curvibacter sp. APW13 TaxID=3077236 RepID=UPI0028DFB7AE|nr:FAD-binding oxidoreductase [Curvibacter sp. APW13]MDT8990524.1 FAD-binding oxidoreductase [Curvibacter sp. APW13]
MTSLLELDRSLAAGSYYACTTSLPPVQEPLVGTVHCDVAVVGGGIAGLSTAIELAQRGLSVHVLEGQRLGFGASGRNGGQVLHSLACDLGVVERQLGADAAREVFHTTVESIHLLQQRCAEFSIDADWQPGYVSVAVKPRKARELMDDADILERRYGHVQRRISASEMPDWVNSPRYLAGVYDPLCGHINPLKYTLGLARAARSLGVVVHEMCPVQRLLPGETCTLRTPTGTVRAQRVVLAGNVHLHGIDAPLHDRVMPVASYIIATQALDRELVVSLVPSGAAVSDNNVVLDYFRTTPDLRMLYGGRVGFGRTPPPDYAAVMRARMVRTFPALASAHIDFQWGGYVDITMNRAPDFGRLGPHQNVYYLQGFCGHGVALSGMAGRMVAQAIAGDAARFDVFSRLRHRPFPGGPWLRTPALVLGMGWYRLKDALA